MQPIKKTSVAANDRAPKKDLSDSLIHSKSDDLAPFV